MDPEELEQLQKDVKQIKDIVTRDHHMMGVLYRYHRWSRAYALLKILVIAAVILGAYYYLEPLIAPAVNVYDKVSHSPLLNASSSSSGFMKYFK